MKYLLLVAVLALPVAARAQLYTSDGVHDQDAAQGDTMWRNPETGDRFNLDDNGDRQRDSSDSSDQGDQ